MASIVDDILPAAGHPADDPVAKPPARAAAVLGARWYVLGVTMLIYTVSIADRYVFSQVQEQIRLELGLTDFGIGVLGGVSLGLFYVTMGIPLSWIADRKSRRNLLVFALGAWSVATTLCGLSRTYWQLLCARIGVGVGEAGGTPPCTAIVADYFPIDLRPMAMAIFALGAPIGAWVGADFAGQIAHAYGWRAAFLALGVPGVVLAAVVRFTVREPLRGQTDAVAPGAAPSMGATLRYLWSQKSAMHLLMSGGVTCFWGWGLMWFTAPFLERTYLIDEARAGSITGPVHLIMGIGSSLAAAWLLNKHWCRNPRIICRLLGWLVALSTVPSIMVYATHSLTLATVGLWLFVPAIYLYIGPTMALLQNVAPANMRATFVAISLLIANIFNLVIVPAGIGWLSNHFAGSGPNTAASLRAALLFLAPVGFWGAFHYFMAARSIEADQQRAVGTC